MDWSPQLQILGEVALAMLLGAAIGLERELADKPAGLRTHMLVAGASALLVGLGSVAVQQFAGSADGDLVSADPIRVIQAIIGGITFLGAGTILRRRGSEQIEGLTTAASILFAAAVGIAVALLQIVLAVGATVLVLGTLRGLRFFSRRKSPSGDDEPPEQASRSTSRDSANGRGAATRSRGD